MISVVIETFNLAHGDLVPLARSVATLAPRLRAHRAELVITTTGPRIDLAYPARWVEVPADTGYYDHKTSGFDASRGDIVAFLDGDCAPVANWLDAIVAPFAHGAQVVCGATSYPGPLARIANEMDFPYFDPTNRRFAARGTARPADRAVPAIVQNFFANNVAFAREVFAAHPYRPAPMFHGQCQLLALELREAAIEIHHAPGAHVEHAWPATAREFIETRLLRGADCASLLPHIVHAHLEGVRLPDSNGARPLPQLAAMAILGLRGLLSAAKSRTPRELAFVAAVTALDSLGAAAQSIVYERTGVLARPPSGSGRVDAARDEYGACGGGRRSRTRSREVL